MRLAKCVFVVMFLVLTACGGGGGNPGGNNQSLPNANSSIVSLSASSSSVANSAIELHKLTRTNTPLLVGGLVDLIGFSKAIPNELMNAFLDIYNVADGKYSDTCQNAGGTYIATISNQSKKIVETFNNCVFDGTHYSGSRSIELDSKKSSSVAIVQLGWTNFQVYEVASPGESETLNGKVSYEGRAPQYVDNDNKFVVHLDFEISSPTEGVLILKNGIFNLTYPNPFALREYDFYFSDEQDVSGTLIFQNVGATHFSTVIPSRMIILSGADNSKGYVDPDYSALNISLDENGDGHTESNVNVPAYKFDSHIGLSDIVHNAENKIILRTDVNNPIPQHKELVMGRGGNLHIDISKLFAHSSAELLDYHLVVDGFTNSDGIWNQSSAGVFDMFFAGNVVDESYKLTFVISDRQGGKHELPVSLFVGADFDGDNVPDAKDYDDDNDGVHDNTDKFPLDPLDSQDFDGDGVGDNRDPDIDNDEVLNSADAYPRDANCSMLTAGDGERCYSSYSTKFWFMDAAGIVYSSVYSINISGKSHYLTNRWNTKTGEYIKPLEFSSFNYHSFSEKTQKIFSNINRSLHVTDLDSGVSSPLVENIGNFSIEYIEQNYIVITRMLSGASESEIAESYTMEGQLINSVKTYPEGRKTPTVAPKFAHLCESYITTNTDGILEVVLGARQTPRCFFGLGDIDYSLDGTRYFAYVAPFTESAIYSANRDFMFNVDVANRLSSFWTQSGFVVVNANPLTLTANEVVFYNDSGEASVRFSYAEDEEHMDVVSNSEHVVLLSRVLLTKKLRARTFDKDLNLLSVKDY
jgi:hypothetical protein